MNKRKIAIVTHDLLPGRERLMPWRTVLEVTLRMRKLGDDVRLVSLTAEADNSHVSHEFDLPLYCCSKVSDLPVAVTSGNDGPFSPELVYWPVTWRSGLKVDSRWHPWDCATVAYHGGGCYRARHVGAALRYLPVRSSRTLLVETFVPKSLLVHKLKKKGVGGVLCMTDLTKRMFVKAGWPNEKIISMPPGLPAIEENAQDALPIKELNNGFSDRPYVLFLGNPLSVRGIDVLVSAARRVFAQSRDVRIVCLLRPDPGEEMRIAREKILHRVNNLAIDGQFVCITRQLEPHEVRQIIKNARAVVMPFLFIPSEIPLGVLEAMQLGTPVITTQSGGTSEHVGDGGWIVAPGNATALAKAITSALHDDETRRRKAAVCLDKMANHSTWEEVGDAWREFGSLVLEESAK